MGRANLPGLPLAGAPARRFVVVFVITAAALLGEYYFPHGPGAGGSSWLDAYLRAYARVVGACLHLADRAVTVNGAEIAGRYTLRIVSTCDAMDVTILFVSAVVAWPSPWRRRAAAAAIGVAALFALNVLRICSLYYVGIHFPSSFDTIHLQVWPLAVLVAAVAAFFWSSRWMSSAEARPASR